MTRSLPILGMALAAALACGGCLVVAAAAVAAGVVYTTSDDCAEVTAERPLADVFAAAEAVLAECGHADWRDPEAGRLEGHVGDATVEITIAQRSEQVVGIHVKARRNSGLSPAPDTAEHVAFGIVKKLGY